MKQPRQLMCVYCGATRPSFYIPRIEKRRGLTNILHRGFSLHLLSGINSTIPSTREYWRGRFPETKPLWREALQ